MLPWIKPGGGFAVCASGPASLTGETANAVSPVQLSENWEWSVDCIPKFSRFDTFIGTL